MTECPNGIVIGAAETPGGTRTCAFGGADPPAPPTPLAPGWGTPDTSCGGVASPTSRGCAVPATRFGGVMSPVLGRGECLSSPGRSLTTGVCGAAWLNPGGGSILPASWLTATLLSCVCADSYGKCGGGRREHPARSALPERRGFCRHTLWNQSAPCNVCCLAGTRR